MAKPTFFPFHFYRFMKGVNKFTASEIGGYVLLLIEQFESGHIPSDRDELKILSKIKNDKSLDKLIAKFNLEESDKLRNQFMKEVREEVYGLNTTLSISGKNGAKKRWGKDRGAISPDINPANSNPISPANSNRIEENRREENRIEESRNRIGLDKIKKVIDESEQAWVEACCMQMRITKIQFWEHIDKFLLFLPTGGIYEKTIPDFRTHFRNWSAKNPPVNTSGQVYVFKGKTRE